MRVGVAGLGVMGAAVAARLMEVGHEVTVWNRTPEKTKALADTGAKVASTPAQLASAVEATITMLTMAWIGKGSSHQRVMQLVLSDGYIEDVSIQASESGKAVALKEKLTLSYAKSTLLYFPFDAARRARGNMTTKFELVAKAHR